MNTDNSISNFTLDIKKTLELKDQVLDYIAESFNVAQFASFAPCDLKARYSRIYGFQPNEHGINLESTLQTLFDNSHDKSVNIRTFKPGFLKGNPFYYGIKTVTEAVELLKKSAADGFYTIVNETIDIHDGGVSGVVMNDIIEFSPHDTPKCVEKEGICSLPRETGIRMLTKVYGFAPNLTFKEDLRVEFSLHPKRRGFQKSHTIIWEVEQGLDHNTDFDIFWPNNFSRFIGDKAFGLLIADEFGALVPRATLLARNVAPFSFGKATGLSEIWFRTCPIEKMAGKFPTYFGWSDPFELMKDAELNQVASILSQQSVDAVFSGAAVPSKIDLLIEGVIGFGDEFMIGKASPEKELPNMLIEKIKQIYSNLKNKLGEINFEWVYDGKQVWLVQLSRSTVLSSSKVIYPGKVSQYISFHVNNNLEELRSMIQTLPKDTGIQLIGKIGITSHFGDVLRNAHVPSKLKSN